MPILSKLSDINISLLHGFQTPPAGHDYYEHPLYEPWNRILEASGILLSNDDILITTIPQCYAFNERNVTGTASVVTHGASLNIGIGSADSNSTEPESTNLKIDDTPDNIIDYLDHIVASTFTSADHLPTESQAQPKEMSVAEAANLDAVYSQIRASRSTTPTLPLAPVRDQDPEIIAEIGVDHVIPDFITFMSEDSVMGNWDLIGKRPIIVTEVKPMPFKYDICPVPGTLNDYLYARAFVDMLQQIEKQATYILEEYRSEDVFHIFILLVAGDRFQLAKASRGQNSDQVIFDFIFTGVGQANAGLSIIFKNPNGVWINHLWEEVWRLVFRDNTSPTVKDFDLSLLR